MAVAMVALLAATGLVAPSTSSAQAPASSCCGTSVYTNDFQGSNAGPGWTANTTLVSNNAPLPTTTPRRRFLGPYGTNHIVTFDSTAAGVVLPTHTELLVSFDLYVIRSWDGSGNEPPNCPACVAPDRFIVEDATATTRTVFDASFDNYDYGRAYGTSGVAGSVLLPDQSFPATYDPGPNAATNWPGQGASEINTLGYGFGPDNLYPTEVRMNAVYRITIPIDHTASNVVLKFRSTLTQALSDESWGIDNLCISVPDADSFGSEFETNSTGWAPEQPNQTWTLGSGSFSNPFPAFAINFRQESIAYTNPNDMSGNFANGSYEVAFRRFDPDNCLSCGNGVWIRAQPEPGPTYRAIGWWNRGYLFMISRDSTFSIVKSRFPSASAVNIVNKQPLFRMNANGVSEPIVHGADGAQNVLRVDFNGRAVNFYVNGILVYSTCSFDSQYTTGKVGVFVERNNSDVQPSFSVDYARLCTTTLECGTPIE